MNRLGERIARLIEASGPLSVADYMALCLFDPEEGYYTTRQPFGADGDFTTAPEISQMFGELVGVWIYSAWAAIGRPLPVTIAEIGPGRGTLMKDILRTLSRLDAGLAASVLFHDRGKPSSEQRPEGHAGGRRSGHFLASDHCDAARRAAYHHCERTLRCSACPPIRASCGTMAERCIGLVETQRLHFLAGVGSLDKALLPPDAENAPDGSIFEVSKARDGNDGGHRRIDRDA